uniref:DUF4114 domain-containing protein n=1 Tax=Roseihalotalea indica TaxID=2867963 RepID=A0AA49JD87_9BACT|nr:DUF4114 domain-containing protein [Tunicatimonas sp. TK19036]
MNKNTLQLFLWVIYVATLAISVSGCREPDDLTVTKENPVIINNPAGLDSRIQVTEGDVIVPIKEAPQYTAQGRVEAEPPEDLNYVLMLRAEVDAPQWENQTLQASHVFVQNSLAYVTYNTQGSSFRGGLDVIDVSNRHAPALKSQAIFPNTEFSSVAVNDSMVYLTGAQLDEEELSSPAIIEIIPYSSEGLAEERTTIDLPSYVGTDIKVDDQYIYVTYGSNGGLSVYDIATLELVKQITLDDARSLILSDNDVLVMQGSPARVSVISKTTWEVTRSYATDGADRVGAKSIFDITDDALFIPTGEEGLKILDRQDGTLVEHIALPTLEDINPEDISTNGVSVANDKIFAANGAAGLYVMHNIDGAYQLFGSASFGGSVNYVMSQGNLMFVATGTSGLKIVEILEYDPDNGDYITIGDWDEYGRPNYLCETESAIDADLEARINAQFMKDDDLTLRQSAWFEESALTEILFKEDTDIEITVLSETTHHKNTFGFYTYDPENIPTSSNDLKDMTVVFPNATVTTSGSHLMKGDKVCLSDFKAGSQLGFFLAFKGFVDGEVTTGYRTHYSSRWLNKNRTIKQQNVLLADPENQTLILAYEDIQRPYDDQDFDDGIFLITFSNANAVDWSAFLKLPE